MWNTDNEKIIAECKENGNKFFIASRLMDNIAFIGNPKEHTLEIQAKGIFGGCHLTLDSEEIKALKLVLDQIEV